MRTFLVDVLRVAHMALPLQLVCYTPQGLSLRADHVEDARHYLHLRLVNLVGILCGIKFEAISGGMRAYNLTFAHFTELTPARPLGCLCPLELGELVEDAVSQLSFSTLIAAIVESAHLRSVLITLLAQEVVVGGLAGKAVPILEQVPRKHR